MISPQCGTAVRMFAAGNEAIALGWHAACRNRECGCLHHRQERTPIADLLFHQSRQKMLARGIDLEAPDGPRLICRHRHDLTVPNALNSRGECRVCRRESSYRYKQRKKLELVQAELLAPVRGIVVPELPRLWIVADGARGRVVTELPPVQRGRRLAG